MCWAIRRGSSGSWRRGGAVGRVDVDEVHEDAGPLDCGGGTRSMPSPRPPSRPRSSGDVGERSPSLWSSARSLAAAHRVNGYRRSSGGRRRSPPAAALPALGSRDADIAMSLIRAGVTVLADCPAPAVLGACFVGDLCAHCRTPPFAALRDREFTPEGDIDDNRAFPLSYTSVPGGTRMVRSFPPARTAVAAPRLRAPARSSVAAAEVEESC